MRDIKGSTFVGTGINGFGIPTRRSFLFTASATFVCAPTVVRAGTLKLACSLGLATDRPCAGFCERLMYQGLSRNLRTGRMTTRVNGKIIPEAEARRLVTHARAQRWLSPEAT